jgi:amino acid transporter
MIMASRVLYGMSSRNLLPAILGMVNQRTQTPLVATALTTVTVLLLAASGTLASLAETTSLIMLVVFSLVNLSLLYVKRRHPKPEGLIVFPLIIPLLGFLVSAGFVLLEITALIGV